MRITGMLATLFAACILAAPYQDVSSDSAKVIRTINSQRAADDATDNQDAAPIEAFGAGIWARAYAKSPLVPQAVPN